MKACLFKLFHWVRGSNTISLLEALKKNKGAFLKAVCSALADLPLLLGKEMDWRVIYTFIADISGLTEIQIIKWPEYADIRDVPKGIKQSIITETPFFQ